MTTTTYTGYISAKSGTILGGVKSNTSTPFTDSDDALSWLLQALEANRAAGRDVEGEVQTRWDGKVTKRQGTALRFVPTYVKKDGTRTLMRKSQGRDTFETPEAAQEWINAVTANNSADNVRQVWGDDPCFEVRPCPCWPGHFDPQTVYFD